MATQYAAFLHYDQGHIQEAYKILIPIKDRLDPDATGASAPSCI
jgi:hypothetical protein